MGNKRIDTEYDTLACILHIYTQEVYQFFKQTQIITPNLNIEGPHQVKSRQITQACEERTAIVAAEATYFPNAKIQNLIFDINRRALGPG